MGFIRYYKKNEEGRFVLFRVEDENPLNYNAYFKTLFIGAFILALVALWKYYKKYQERRHQVNVINRHRNKTITDSNTKQKNHLKSKREITLFVDKLYEDELNKIDYSLQSHATPTSSKKSLGRKSSRFQKTPHEKQNPQDLQSYKTSQVKKTQQQVPAIICLQVSTVYQLDENTHMFINSQLRKFLEKKEKHLPNAKNQLLNFCENGENGDFISRDRSFDKPPKKQPGIKNLKIRLDGKDLRYFARSVKTHNDLTLFELLGYRLKHEQKRINYFESDITRPSNDSVSNNNHKTRRLSYSYGAEED